MNQEELKQFFPAGGNVDENIDILDVQATSRDDVLVGMAVLPLTTAQQKIVIYQLTLSNGEYDYRAISASCPHQGADISRDVLKPDGNVYCSLHRRPICIYSKFNQAYAVVKHDEQYIIAKNS
ncbi:Rieske (2Fe-2S) protein [Pseudocolwellia sp. HL-MZ7]|uniref:Rieske (2Fe-2S) protein n=1 Tax=Pseudocolwellia sp. HL-MZ7 TaxID=3400627 RepID=UPI003CF5EED0